MRGKHGNHVKASRQHRWKAGGRVGSSGYVKVRVGKDHPLADPNGWTYEHLVVWVSAGKPRPARNEVLHHINEDKTDNRIENLRIMRRDEHSQMHGQAISDADVKSIRLAYANGTADMATLAAQYGIATARVSKFIRGESRLKAGGPTSKNNQGKARAAQKGD